MLHVLLQVTNSIELIQNKKNHYCGNYINKTFFLLKYACSAIFNFILKKEALVETQHRILYAIRRKFALRINLL